MAKIFVSTKRRINFRWRSKNTANVRLLHTTPVCYKIRGLSHPQRAQGANLPLIPRNLGHVCPISYEPVHCLTQAILAEDRYIYDRGMLRACMQRSLLSPMTGQLMHQTRIELLGAEPLMLGLAQRWEDRGAPTAFIPHLDSFFSRRLPHLGTTNQGRLAAAYGGLFATSYALLYCVWTLFNVLDGTIDVTQLCFVPRHMRNAAWCASLLGVAVDMSLILSAKHVKVIMGDHGAYWEPMQQT